MTLDNQRRFETATFETGTSAGCGCDPVLLPVKSVVLGGSIEVLVLLVVVLDVEGPVALATAESMEPLPFLRMLSDMLH